MQPRLYLSRVMHRRRETVHYRFDYRVFSLLLDVDDIDRGHSPASLLRINRPGLLSLHRKDHGPRDGSALRPWIQCQLDAAGLTWHPERIFLLSFPRVLGYVFNPLSLYYCLRSDGQLGAVIAEVRNTFGQMHPYVLHADGDAVTWPARLTTRKTFHVSPLMDMDYEYRFRLTEPAHRLAVIIQQFRRGELALVATQTGDAQPLTNPALFRAVLRTPLMTLKVIAAIHWQALKIWLRGARFHPTPKPQ